MFSLTHHRRRDRRCDQKWEFPDCLLGGDEPLCVQRRRFRTELLSSIGGVIAGGGIVWTLNAASHHPAEIIRFGLFPPGPLEVLGMGILLWLFAQWSSVAHRRKLDCMTRISAVMPQCDWSGSRHASSEESRTLTD